MQRWSEPREACPWCGGRYLYACACGGERRAWKAVIVGAIIIVATLWIGGHVISGLMR